MKNNFYLVYILIVESILQGKVYNKTQDMDIFLKINKINVKWEKKKKIIFYEL